ncbi:response regulator [Vreelandella aquamarina]
MLVVNESGFIREGLCKVIERFRGVDVVGSTHCAHDLEVVVRSLHANVVLIDSQFPDQIGFHAARRLHESGLETHVVILSVSPSLADVRRALEAGAVGFLLREAGISDLEAALHAAVKNEVFLCPTLFKQLYEIMAPGDALKGISIGVNNNQHCYSIDDMLVNAQRLGILH